jgi:hypothetical protein
MRAYRRNFPWDVDVLGESHLALVERALEVCLADGVASICLLVDQGDQAVLDLQVHFEALLNLLLEVTRGLDGELLATSGMLAGMIPRDLLHLNCICQGLTGATLSAVNVRLGWVGVDIGLLDLQDVVRWVATEVQWVIAGHFVFLFDRDLVTADP